jgi:hypothetical protein
VLFSFFAATGILLNHDSFGLDQVLTSSGRNKLEPDMVRRGEQGAIVNSLRSLFGIRLPVTRYSLSAGEIDVTFSAPGKRVQVLIDRETAAAEATFESRGLAGQLADLHKGAASGLVWRVVMDVTSAYLLVSAASGTLLMLSIPRRRRMGILAVSGGAIAVTIVYLLCVPR